MAGTDAASNYSVSIDLDFKLVDSENTYFPGSVKQDIQFHRGFYLAFKRIIPDLNTAVQTGVEGGAKTIIVTGHSLGELRSFHQDHSSRQAVLSRTLSARTYRNATRT